MLAFKKLTISCDIVWDSVFNIEKQEAPQKNYIVSHKVKQKKKNTECIICENRYVFSAGATYIK